MHAPVDDTIRRRARERFREWGALWGVPGLEEVLTIEVSGRMRASLARCWVGQGRIKLAAPLRAASPELLDEVLCHEAAHAAIAHLHHERVRPHGREWGALMEAAGYAPRTRLPAEMTAHLPWPKVRYTRWRHRCSVCRVERTTRRVMRQWRCAACVRAGRDGVLTIAKLPPEA